MPALPAPITVRSAEALYDASVRFTLTDGTVIDTVVAGQGSNLANREARPRLLQAVQRTIAFKEL